VLSVVLPFLKQEHFTTEGTEITEIKKQKESKLYFFPRCPLCSLWLCAFLIKNIQPQSSQRTTEKKTGTQTHTSLLCVLGALCGFIPFNSKTFYHRAHREPQSKKPELKPIRLFSVSSVPSVVIPFSNQKHPTTELTENHRVKNRDQAIRLPSVSSVLSVVLSLSTQKHFTTELTE
jgi:hypothetical protein